MGLRQPGAACALASIIAHSFKKPGKGTKTTGNNPTVTEGNMRVPLITAREWRSIAPHLPPTNGPGKPRQDDRRYVSAFFYCEATSAALESLPAAYGNPRSLRTRRQRWQADGTLAKLMQDGEPVIRRMREEYFELVRNASFVGGRDWRTSEKFFGSTSSRLMARARSTSCASPGTS